MSRTSLAAAVLGLLVGFGLGRWACSPTSSSPEPAKPLAERTKARAERPEAPKLPSSVETPSDRTETYASWSERWAREQSARAEESIAAVAADPPSWGDLIPEESQPSRVLPMLQQVDDAVVGANLPHDARFLDEDCSEPPCLFALWVPNVSTHDDPNSAEAHEEAQRVEEAVAEFGEWMALRGLLETRWWNYTSMGDVVVVTWAPPRVLPLDTYEEVETRVNERAGFMSVAF